MATTRTLSLLGMTGIAALVALTGPDGAARSPRPPVAPSPVVQTAPGAEEWEIGPVIRGRNYSVGMPPTPAPVRGGLWAFDFPVGSEAAGHVHYVTFRPASLAGARSVVMRYRIDAPRGTRFIPRQNPDLPGTVSLYLQRRGDDWRARRGTQWSRWYAPDASVMPLSPGVHEVRVALNDPAWISVLGKRADSNPAALAQAIADIDRIGLVFGSTRARGHGVYATESARFTLLSFRIE